MTAPAEAHAGTRTSRAARRVDALLTRERLTVYPVVVIVLFLVVWAVSLRVTTALPDFLARWTAGRMLLDGNLLVLYDPAAQSALQQSLGAERLSWFVSPPYTALLLVPYGAMPYWLAAVVWTLVTLLLLAFTARALAGLDPRLAALGRPGGLLVVASCQPVLELVGAGQDTALVLAALAGGALLLRRGSEAGAGVALAAGLVKPHLMLLVPVALLLGRCWRALTAFVAAGLALAALATALLGMRVWWHWVDAVASPLYSSEVGQGQAWKTVSMGGLSHYLLDPLSVTLATVVQLAATAVLLVVVARRVAWRTTPPWLLVLVVVPLVTVLVVPHVVVYDLVLALPAAVLLAAVGQAEDRALLALGYVVLFLAPLLHLLAEAVGWLAWLGAPWVCLVLVGLCLRAVAPSVLADVTPVDAATR